jgi:hypothetical protein
MRRQLLVGFPLFGGLLVATAAAAWSQNSEFGARVHDHEFKRVIVESADCTLKYKLYFSAPAAGYTSKSPPRNVYRFRSRIDFQSGKVAKVPIFVNRAAGERMYVDSFDTTGEGCWAKTQEKLAGVKVEACRGDGCSPKEIF